MITENNLDAWVRANARDAQGLIVELVYRLVSASSPKPKERRFPLGDSTGQPGPDGMLDTEFSFNPFVPDGRSFWEIGTGINAGRKATSDYKGLTDATPEEIRRGSTFIFITPLSGSRDWQYTWKEDAQAVWIKERRENNEWKDVRVIDGSGLIDWLRQFPAVELWLLAIMMGPPALQIETVEQHWADLSYHGSPPTLISDVFLTNRKDACDKLNNVFDGTTILLKLETHFPNQVADFISAYVENMDKERKTDVVGRCLIISSAECWKIIMDTREQHFLVANFDLDDDAGTKLLEMARRARHAVIYHGSPGGLPLPPQNRASLSSPRINQIQDALEKSGYKKERARILAQRSDGNLGSLLRLLLNISLLPEWAQGTDASELVIAEVLGSWSDQSEADKDIAEKLSGKDYGEWIRIMREIALHQGTPLNHRNDNWRITSRYEGWYVLGPKLFDDFLDCFKKVAVEVLRERDPKFELASDKRFMASIYGKVLNHSFLLRKGLAESLALIGSHSEALKSCSAGKAETIACLTVRDILSNADWVLWASLNDILPLLAEAAPGEFLDTVENALDSYPCPFSTIFEQGGSGTTSVSYMTGLLWALETLAWDAEYLIRVVVLLGKLEAKGLSNQGNNPANSISTILLPWFPQTCAPMEKRKLAVKALICEYPEVAWKLLQSLLPQSQQISLGSRRPAWREMIPDDWSEGATEREYWEQITAYAELAISIAKSDITKLVDLIDRLDDLWPQARNQILDYMVTDAVVSMPEANRVRLWTELVTLVSKHRKFADAEWAMKPKVVDDIAVIAEKLAPNSPIYRHQRLFSERDFDLYEGRGDYRIQQKMLDDRRQKAVKEVFATGGSESVLEFAKLVESPWRVGLAFGITASNEAESMVLPTFLESESKPLIQFAGGFVWGRFWSRQWQWVDEINTSEWTQSQKAQLLAFLPFNSNTWERATRLLGDDEALYWSKANVNPYQAEKNIEIAVDRLIEHGRANAAIICLERMLSEKQSVDNHQAVSALRALLQFPEDTNTMDMHSIVKVVKALQDDPSTNPDELFQIEWAFLPLLNGFQGNAPKSLEQRLADDPVFFCEVIGTAFRPRKDDFATKDFTMKQKDLITNAYHLLHYWRIPPGSQKDGTYDGDALIAWLGKIKEVCLKSGHLVDALTMVGKVLFNTPPDPDGFWIHHSAARALNDEGAKEMRNGFQIAVVASRGVYWGTAGEEERKLALKYRSRANEVEDQGYHRFATIFRNLATLYEHEAELEASRDLHDE